MLESEAADYCCISVVFDTDEVAVDETGPGEGFAFSDDVVRSSFSAILCDVG